MQTFARVLISYVRTSANISFHDCRPLEVVWFACPLTQHKTHVNYRNRRVRACPHTQNDDACRHHKHKRTDNQRQKRNVRRPHVIQRTEVAATVSPVPIILWLCLHNVITSSTRDRHNKGIQCGRVHVDASQSLGWAVRLPFSLRKRQRQQCHHQQRRHDRSSFFHYTPGAPRQSAQTSKAWTRKGPRQ